MLVINTNTENKPVPSPGVSHLCCPGRPPAGSVWAAGLWEPGGHSALTGAPPDDSPTHPDTPTYEGFPAPTHTHKLPLTVSYRDTIQSSKHKKKKTASGSKFCMKATVWNFVKIRTFKQTNKKTKKLYLLVVMRTIGYGPATAPLGWGERQGYPAKRK